MVVGFFYKVSKIIQWRKEAFQQMEIKQPNVYKVKNESQRLLQSKYENQFKMTHRPNYKNQTTKLQGGDTGK